jgi:lysophospholipase L1-like esterase
MTHSNLRRAAAAILVAAFSLSVVPLRAGNEKNYTYLALGDSIPYGLNPTLLPSGPGQSSPAPGDFKGYPEMYSAAEHLDHAKKIVNASCPGETSGSFRLMGIPDNGCYGLGPQGQPPFRTSIGLHTDYAGTQLEFALSELADNKHIDLVTLSLGANDVLLILQDCAPTPDPKACVGARLPAALQAVGSNLSQILAALRQKYTGTIVLLTYYAPSIELIGVVAPLNAIIAEVGGMFNARIADGFGAFQLASALFGGDPCAAGLLVRLNAAACDLHASPKGQRLLAAAVAVSISHRGWKD